MSLDLSFLDGLGLGDGDTSGIDWASILGGDQGGGGPTDTGGAFTIDPVPNGSWGMGDRGLGTTDPNLGLDGTLSPGAIANLLPKGSGSPAGSTSGGTGIGDIIKSITGGGSGIGSLMAMLAPLLGAGLQYKATGKASDQMQQAAKDANALVSGIYGGSKDMYMPYVTAGQNALAKAQGMGYQPMAQNYKPLGSGAAMTLGKLGGR